MKINWDCYGRSFGVAENRKVKQTMEMLVELRIRRVRSMTKWEYVTERGKRLGRYREYVEIGKAIVRCLEVK